jgi:poly(A) polymerase Pap1
MKTYGVTPPVSEAEPSEREWELNRSLIDVLANERMVESEERTKLR